MPARGWSAHSAAIPIVGDFDGDGKDDLATWHDDVFEFDLSSVGAGGPVATLPGLNGTIDATIQFGFIGEREKPVAADMDRDGIDDLGLWVPDMAGVNPVEGGEWYFLISNDPDLDGPGPLAATRVIGTVNKLNHPFEPVPFGADLYAIFGDEFAIPVLGNFDPPVTPTATVEVTLPFGHTNLVQPADVNADGRVSALDVLLMVNEINGGGVRELHGIAVDAPFLDPNGDMRLTPADVLLTVNLINSNVAAAQSAAEGEAARASATTLVQPTLAASPAAQAPAAAPVAAAQATLNVPVVAERKAVPEERERSDEALTALYLADVLDDLAADVAGAVGGSDEQARDGLFARL